MHTVANPLSWLPFHGDKRSVRAAILGGALALSLCFHAGLPFVRWQSVEAISETPITVELMPAPPIPLPDANELQPVPHEVDSDALPVEDQLAVKDAEPIAAEDEPIEEVDEPMDPPPEVAPEPKRHSPAQLERLAELDRRRAERLAQREKRKALREARRLARLGKEGAGGKMGGAPPTGEWKTGKPDAVYLCSGADRGSELHVTKQRPLNEWITIIPTVLGGFQTRPGLGGFLHDTLQVISRDRTVTPRRVGFVELALPDDVLQLELEEPRGVRIAVGRLDARCLIGFKYASKLFPFSILRAPVRIIDRQNNSVSALVDVVFFKDMSIEVVSVDGADLPFKRGRLKNADNIQRNIHDHYEAARLAKGIADLFGISLGPKRPSPAKGTTSSSTNRRSVASDKGKRD